MALVPGRLLGTAISTLLVIGLLAGSAAPAVALHEQMSLRSDVGVWMTDGQVRAMVEVGGTIFLGGRFTELRSKPVGQAGGQVVPVANLAAIDAITGEPASVNSALPGVTGTGAIVYALAVSGTKLILGGKFSTVGASTRRNIAAVDALTGEVLGKTTGWGPPVPKATGGAVWGLEVDEATGTIYAGGTFTLVNGTAVGLMEAFNGDGTVLSGWDPPLPECETCTHDRRVRGLEVSSDGLGIFITGDFDGLVGDSGPPSESLGCNTICELTLDTGALTGWEPAGPTAIGTNAFGIDLYADDLGTPLDPADDRLYVGEGGSDFVMALDQNPAADPVMGNILWKTDTNGSVQAVARVGSSIVVGGHYKLISPVPAGAGGGGVGCGVNETPDLCVGFLRLSSLGLDGVLHQDWEVPVSGAYNGVWATVFDSAGHLYIGGEFKKVGGDGSYDHVAKVETHTGFDKRSNVARFSPL